MVAARPFSNMTELVTSGITPYPAGIHQALNASTCSSGRAVGVGTAVGVAAGWGSAVGSCVSSSTGSVVASSTGAEISVAGAASSAAGVFAVQAARIPISKTARMIDGTYFVACFILYLSIGWIRISAYSTTILVQGQGQTLGGLACYVSRYARIRFVVASNPSR